MRGWLTRTWAQVIAVVLDRASTGTQLVLRLRRNLAGVATGGSMPPRATKPQQVVCLHESVGEPYAEMGEVGHWYVDLLASRLYGPKQDDGWPKNYITLLEAARDRLGRLERDMTAHYAVEKIHGPTPWWLRQTMEKDS